MIEGDTGVISAHVVPAGSPVTWSSSDDTVAIVDNGTVTAIAAGAATITGTITVDGIDYSDTCSVEIEAAPISNLVFDLTDSDNWNNSELWNKQDYQEDSRGTYIRYADGFIECVTNADGSSSTLYADISPLTGNFIYDDSFNYYLNFEYENPTENEYRIQLTSGSAVMFTADGWSELIPHILDGSTELLPLALSNDSAARLITIQVRKIYIHDANGIMRFKAKIIREPK